MRAFRFGVQMEKLDDRALIRGVAIRAEILGYRDLFSFDHIGDVDPFVPLLIASEATSRLRVGPLVLNNEFHHPALLARTATTVDRLTNGRLTVGIGTGYMQSEHDAIGLLLREPGRRVDRFIETLTVLRELFDSGRVHSAGDHHDLHVDDLGVRPLQQRLPLLIGGHGRRVVGAAGRFADIFQYTGLTHGEGGKPQPGGFAVEQLIERSQWLAEAAGERLADIELSALVQYSYVGDDAAQRADYAAGRFGLDRQVIDDTPFALIGSREQVIDKIERLRLQLGISHFVVRDAEGFAPIVEVMNGR